MRNLRLLATVLFVAVLLVGIVLLLRQTNVPNDTSVTSAQVTNQQLAVKTTAQTDPPIRVKKAKGAKIANGVQPITSGIELSKTSHRANNQRELTDPTGMTIQSGVNTATTSATRATQPAANVNTVTWNPKASKAEQVRALQQMLREESNPKAKAKIQHKLNSLK